MKPHRVVWALLLACTVGWGGCKARTTPPGPTMLTGTGESGTYRFLFWKGGPTILICADFRGYDSARGEGSTGDAVHRETGSMWAADGRRFEWHAENTGGQGVKFTLAETPYDLTQGCVFLVTTEGRSIHVQQLTRDLSALQPTLDSSVAFVTQDPDVSKLIGRVLR
jgi:hypothetical protein